MELRDIPDQPGYRCSADGRVFSMKSGTAKEMALFVRDRSGMALSTICDIKKRKHWRHV